MKKFLSLLLALTMVLSLTVVPARAHDAVSLSASQASIEVNTSTTVTATVPAGKTMAEGYPRWSTSDSTVTATQDSSNANSASVTGTVAKESVTITYTYKYNDDGATEQTATTTITITDNAGALRNAITSVKYNERESFNSTSKSVAAYKFSEDTTDTWTVTAPGYTVSSATLSSNVLTITATKEGESSTPVTTTIPCTLTTATVSVTAKPTTVVKDGTATLTANATNVPNTTVTYEWKNGENALTGHTNVILLEKPSANASITCKAIYHFSGDVTKTVTTTSATPVTVDSNTYTWSGVPTTTLNMAKGDTNITALPAIKLVTTSGNSTTDATGVTYTYTNSNPAAVTVDGTTIRAVGSGYATITITAKDETNADANYRGKLHATTITVSSTALEYSLGSVTNGSGAHYYSYDNLRYNDVTSLMIKSSSATALGGVFAPASGTLTSTGLTYTAPNATIGKASITLTAATARGNFDIAYTISVTPISTTFETVTAEPITSSSTYYNNTYRVTFPTTSFNQFYVVNKTGVAPTDYSSYNLVAGTTSTTLNASDFNATTGTCTLFVIAWNSNYNYNYNWSTGYAGKYYCGPITVSQTNYNINYNGVAGETVQFKHADFTNFMNEVSQARGDASKTGSYPYVTFNYVTFNYPTSTQGTLYYNGTAMSNSSYSGSFNSRTQITNLDNVTFVPYARTNAKSIPLTFTLSVTKYGANGAVVNRDLKYTGTVAVSIVREDIKYTAAPGDTIRFTDSDFLNYLRTQNGFNSNYYSIDYVTFDQSAVNALNEGVLYSYYSGYNAVKTTDKFYYTTTSYNQNALSDVTFRASAYAKTGTTVYIPFTIYARYGTTGTGTRQVSGTVAIKLAQTMNFVDVKPTDYFYDSVKWAVNSNITKGTSATTFSPYKTCTRAEIVTFLWRAAGSKTPTITRNPFTDVAPSMGMDYYYAILWASQNGIAAGTSATTFSPNATCTRAQIVTFLWRYSNKPAGYYSNPFTDVNKAEHAAYYDAILWAVGKGITKGTTATTFSPYGTCTRGEAVTFLYRAVNGK